MKDLVKYLTLRIKGEDFVPTIIERKYTYRINYTVDNLEVSYPIIKDDFTNEGWKRIKTDIKDDFKHVLKKYEIALKRKELFGV